MAPESTKMEENADPAPTSELFWAAAANSIAKPAANKASEDGAPAASQMGHKGTA